jgi:putative ABC transport system permease protein
MHPALALWDAAVFGPMRRSLGRTWLSVFVIALGVALGFAVFLINRTAADEISRAARSLYGLADFAIEGDAAGFDENLYPAIAKIEGIETASPVVEIAARLADRRGLVRVLGIDPFRAQALQPTAANLALAPTSTGGIVGSQAMLLSASAARDLGLTQGDTLALQVGTRRETFEIAGVLPGIAFEERAALLDIATAQWKLDALGKLHRINVRLAPEANAARVRESIRRLLPPNARLVTPGQSTDDALRLSRAYRANLTALAFVALFTGGFLVYSTQTLAILRRRRELALLHALGVTHARQFVHTLVEATVVGLLGASIGVAIGFFVAQFALQLTGADLGAGYVRVATSTLYSTATEWIVFIGLGAVTAVAGAVYPALQATRVPTAAALKSGDASHTPVRAHGSIAIVVASLAGALSFVPAIGELPLAGYASIALLILATIIAIPTLLQRVLGPLPTIRAVAAELALAHLRGSGRYATLSVAAIVVSFSLMVAMLIMVTSFRGSLDAWTEKILPADVYLRVGYVGQSAYIDTERLQALGEVSGVARTTAARFAQITLHADRPPLTLIAREIDPAHVEDEIWLTAAIDPRREDAHLVPLWVSESAADLFDLAPGDIIELPLSGGRRPAQIRGVWRDYEHPNGAVLIERAIYVKLTGDEAVNAVSFWLAPNAAIDAVRDGIRAVLGSGIQYDVRTPRELRRMSLQVFDRTFAVTYVLEIVAIVIGLFGISAGISAQVLARRTEFGVLRHLGMTRAQIARMLATEGAVLGALGVLVGLTTGAVVSMILIYVVNRQSFHWSMDVFVPALPLAVCSAILLAAAASIAVVSGRTAMSGEVVRAVKEDW